MARILSDRQQQLLDYLRTRYEANEPLPPKRQICKELGLVESELHGATRILERFGYIEEAPDALDGPPYRVLLDREGKPLPRARPSYLQGTRAAQEHPGQPDGDAPGKLTQMESRVLRLIHAFFRERGYPPTLADLDARSLTTGGTQLRNHFIRLADKGWIERLDGGARAIRLKPCAFQLLGPICFGRPAVVTDDSQAQILVLGEIAAGRGRYVGDQIPMEELHVPIRLIRKYDRTELFAVRVVGRSMVERGLQPGDYLVVHAQPQVESGELVTALVDEGDPKATVKMYRKQDDRAWLEPANARMGLAPIPVDGATLQGKVIALLRFYEDQPIRSSIG
jgi:repressor LexA